MYAYKKYVQEPIQFVNYSKQIYATNELPKITDNSHAFFRRPIIKFPKAFTLVNGKKDPGLISKLTTGEELSGLLNEAIKGWIRLNQKCAFSIQPTSMDIEEMWIKDTIQEFVDECLETGSKDDKILFEVIYTKYGEYLHKQDDKSKDSVGNSSFELKLKKYISFEKKDHQSVAHDNTTTGIRFKNGESKNGRL